MAKELEIPSLVVHSNFQLVVNQVNGMYQTNWETMDYYLQIVRKELENFKSVQIKQIPRFQNNHADALARLATSEEIEEFDSIPVSRISQQAIKLAEVIVMGIDPKPTWLDEIVSYLKIGMCPEDIIEARRLQIRAARYTLIDNSLYKRGYSTPLLRCLNEKEA